MNTKLYYWPCW